MELQTLIDEVDARSAGPEAMLRLRTAVEVAAEANELADELIDHAVDRARAAGASWTQIGDVLGVSRQAAQQRQGSWLSRLFGGGRGEDERRRVLHGRFTRDARTTVVEAQHAARALGHDAIGTEHLLLGILATAGSIGARALAEHHLERALVEERIAEIERDRPTGSRRRHLRFNPRARKVLELALREAVRLRHEHVGTEHLLLAVLREGEGVAAKILAEQHVTHAAVERFALDALAAERSAGAGG